MPGRLRRVTIYETASRFYIVGCDASGTKFNVLKIDRVDSRVLLTGEPDACYTRDEILELLATISEGNSVVYRSTPTKKNQGKGLIERVSNAYGILGVVRFLEGYYLIVITKANIVGTIGYHSILKIAEVAMISITMDGVSSSSEEQKYVKLFQSVDLSTDFYFTYTYDLSRTFQENLLSVDWDKNGERVLASDKKFVWNSFLLDPLRKNLVSERWFVEVVHGFVGQQLFDLPTAKISLTLIGRRSAEFAGTRYLKRGANLHGSVANDVETEQILWDVLSSPRFDKGRFTAFVQRRGSVPLRWSQDPATRGVVGKPLILIDIHEPHAQTAAAHFRDLRKKYGSPLVVMNLVKRREKRYHESLLHDQFLKAIRYLNQFLPPEERICYLSFDVARCNKSSTPTSNVLTKLEEIALKAIVKHGWCQTFQLPYSRKICPKGALIDFEPSISDDGQFLVQRGISRTNCVDCLDRTNVAQFAIGKAALGCQLYSMGVIDEPSLSLASEVCRVYEEMFDDHGDTMAWQYAGSQLVHSIKTYKKTAAFQERSRDVIQTLSRYYSNTFGDYDKQAAINLFLGVFRPQITSTLHLWDLPTDYYLHFPTSLTIKSDYCAWMYDEDELDDYVMVSIGECDEDFVKKQKLKRNSLPCARSSLALKLNSDEDFRDAYRTFEMSALEPKVKVMQIQDQRAISVSGINDEVTTTGQFMKLWKNEREVKETKDPKGKKNAKESDDEDDFVDDDQQEDVLDPDDGWLYLTKRTESRRDRDSSSLSIDRPILATGLQFARDIYGIGRLKTPPNEVQLYQSYVSRGGFKPNAKDWLKHKPTLLTDLKLNDVHSDPETWRTSIFNSDDIFQSCNVEVSKNSRSFYARSCNVQDHNISKVDLAKFSAYPAIF